MPDWPLASDSMITRTDASPRLAIDDPVVIARLARIVRRALARRDARRAAEADTATAPEAQEPRRTA